MKKQRKSALLNKNTAIKGEEWVTDEELSMVQAKKLLPENLRHLPLIPREYKFLAVYCANGFDAIEAVEKAGYKARAKQGYNAIAFSLLQRKEIVEAIKIYVDTIIKPYKDRLELEILNIYYRRAMYQISDFYDDNGNPKPLNTIPKENQCCIDDINYVRVSNNLVINAYKLPNRDLALQALYRFITGQDLSTTQQLSEENKNKIRNIYKTIIKQEVKPKNIRSKTNGTN